MNRKVIVLVLAAMLPQLVHAQDTTKIQRIPKIGGTIRAKYEYQTSEGEGRFEVRNARVNVTGDISRIVSYKAEIDLCDEGTIKMLDAYTRIKPIKNFQFTIGQMRVPFTIDAHRSPDQQYFANRSFIAKQVGNVRDVGAAIGYRIDGAVPMFFQAGLFNGSGLTNQKDFWTGSVNFSAKAEVSLFAPMKMTLSVQKVEPDSISIMMYDGGLSLTLGNFFAEAEYLYKHYENDAFHPVHSVDFFVNYDIPIRKGIVRKISPLIRYDYMNDHSNGERGDAGVLVINDYQRSRVTGGLTISLSKPFHSDIRINYEKYFYRDSGIPKTSEKDKIVIEFMTHF
jgi:hypothetical protein